MGNVERVQYNGHNVWPGATHLTPYQPGLYFYTVTLSYQMGPGGFGNMSSHGLVEPRHGSQYGELVMDVLEVVRRRCPGQDGSKVMMFFNLVPNGQFVADADGYEDV